MSEIVNTYLLNNPVQINTTQFTSRGDWNSSTTYAVNDLVSYSGSSFSSRSNGNLNNTPSSSGTSTNYWQLLAYGVVISGNAGGDLAGTYPNPTIAAQPYLYCEISGTQAINSGANFGAAYTTITGWRSTTTRGTNYPTVSNGTVTINRSGMYHIDCTTTIWADSGTSNYYIRIAGVNGRFLIRGNNKANGTNYGTTTCTVTTYLASGSPISIQATALNASTLQGNNYGFVVEPRTYLTVTRLSD